MLSSFRFRRPLISGLRRGGFAAGWFAPGILVLMILAICVANMAATAKSPALVGGDIVLEGSGDADADADIPDPYALVADFDPCQKAAARFTVIRAPARAHIPDSFLIPYAIGPPAAG